MRKTGVLKILTVGFIFSTVILSGISLNAKAQAAGYVPVAWLEFTAAETKKFVDVDPRANCTVTFTGTLHVECQWPTITEFEVSCNQPDWTVTISPGAIGLEPGTQEATVNIIVKVPQGTYSEIFGKIDINGITRTATPISYICRFSNSVTAGINKYYSTMIACRDPYREVSPYTRTSFDISIFNLGNAYIDDIKLEIENADELSGWVVNMNASSIPLPGGSSSGGAFIPGSAGLILYVETPREWTAWKDSVKEIKIKIYSDKVPTVEQSYSVFLRLRGTYIPSFDATLVIMALSVTILLIRKLKVGVCK